MINLCCLFLIALGICMLVFLQQVRPMPGDIHDFLWKIMKRGWSYTRLQKGSCDAFPQEEKYRRGKKKKGKKKDCDIKSEWLSSHIADLHPMISGCVCPQERITGVRSHIVWIPWSARLGHLPHQLFHTPAFFQPGCCLAFAWRQACRGGKKKIGGHSVLKVVEEAHSWESWEPSRLHSRGVEEDTVFTASKVQAKPGCNSYLQVSYRQHWAPHHDHFEL